MEVVEYNDFYRSLGNGGGIWVVLKIYHGRLAGEALVLVEHVERNLCWNNNTMLYVIKLSIHRFSYHSCCEGEIVSQACIKNIIHSTYLH